MALAEHYIKILLEMIFFWRFELGAVRNTYIIHLNCNYHIKLCISLSHIFPCLIPFPWADTSRVPHALLSVVAGLSLPSPADSAVSGEEGKNSRII